MSGDDVSIPLADVLAAQFAAVRMAKQAIQKAMEVADKFPVVVPPSVLPNEIRLAIATWLKTHGYSLSYAPLSTEDDYEYHINMRNK